MHNVCSFLPYLMNMLYDESTRDIVELSFVDVENLVSDFQTIAIGWTAIQLYLSISSLHQYYDISLQLNDLLQR